MTRPYEEPGDELEITEPDDGVGPLKITRRCAMTGQKNTLELDVTMHQLFRFASGESVQKVFPDLSDGEREFLLSGMLPEDSARWFGEPEPEPRPDNASRPPRTKPKPLKP